MSAQEPVGISSIGKDYLDNDDLAGSNVEVAGVIEKEESADDEDEEGRDTNVNDTTLTGGTLILCLFVHISGRNVPDAGKPHMHVNVHGSVACLHSHTDKPCDVALLSNDVHALIRIVRTCVDNNMHTHTHTNTHILAYCILHTYT
jgi:hypothetical protein